MFEFVQQTLDPQSAEQLRPYRLGDIVEGTVVGIGRSSLFLDLSPQGTGIIWGREFLGEKDTLRDIKIGEQLKAKIVDLENDEGYIELSVVEAGRELTWSQLKAKKDSQEAVIKKHACPFQTICMHPSYQNPSHDSTPETFDNLSPA